MLTAFRKRHICNKLAIMYDTAVATSVMLLSASKSSRSSVSLDAMLPVQIFFDMFCSATARHFLGLTGRLSLVASGMLL